MNLATFSRPNQPRQAPILAGVQPADPDRFSTFRVSRLRHDWHHHPLVQFDELAALAAELMPVGKCRFLAQNGVTPRSAFGHQPRHPDGRQIDEVFHRLSEPGQWLALYNIEVVPRYRVLLEQILAPLRARIEREQPGIFNLTGFFFLCAPPSVTPFHIDRENNFWLQLHGRKTLRLWDASNRGVIRADAVEDFIVAHSTTKICLAEAAPPSDYVFDSGPGDGVYFPTTSPHTAFSDTSWVRPGDGISAALAVTFYTSHTRQIARAHQFNRACRKYLRHAPTDVHQSHTLNAIKAPAGHIVGAGRQILLRQRMALRSWRQGLRLDKDWWDGRAPPGSY